MTKTKLACLTAIGALAFTTSTYAQEKRYGPGVTDTEIKLGQTAPFSGPVSAYSWISRAQAALFAKVNAEGGINGRKIRLISLDDSYSPPKTVEQTRKLVEEENVLFLFQSIGTGPQSAVRKYLNAKQVPQLFPGVGAESFGDYRTFPWTMMWQPNFRFEARVIAGHILRTLPGAKIGALYQNDDFGRELLSGLHETLGDKRKEMIVAEVSHEIADPTVDSQVIQLQAAGADTVLIFTTPRAAAQAIRKIGNLGWKPKRFVTYAATSVDLVMKPAGFENAEGVVSTAYIKDPSDPGFKNDPETKAYFEWVKRYLPDANPTEIFVAYGYANAHTLVQVLKQCGDDLTRENVMRQAANLKDVRSPMVLDGVLINTGPKDYYPIEQLRMMRFDGKRWVPFGELMGAQQGELGLH